MAKEIKVYLYRGEDDNYNELWKIIDEEKYYARNTFHNNGKWYHVCDPLGYCELDYPVANDVVFILCDKDGNEYCRYSNGQENPLPKFEDFVRIQWNKIKAAIPHNTENMEKEFWSMCFNGETTQKLNQWLVSFMDKDLYPKEIADMYGYEENWYGCWHNKETDYTPIPGSEFEYLGEKYQFVKVHHKHDVCGVEWDTFECCDNPIQMSYCGTETHPFIQSYMELGNWFDNSKYGTMLDKRTARERIVKKLLEVFPKEKKYQGLLLVKDNGVDSWTSRYCCYSKSYEDCADELINRDYHINKINELIENFEERTKNIVFVNNANNKEMICNIYSEIYGYDDCLLYYRKENVIV